MGVSVRAMRTDTTTRSGVPGLDGSAVTLPVTVWSPDEGTPVVADVLLVHGYGEHSGRYAPVAEVLCARGLRVTTWDQRGHGRSTGVRKGDVDDMERFLDDAEAVLADARSELPCFVYGHSMGGLITVRLAERLAAKGALDLAGLVVASAALAPADSIPTYLVSVANVIGKLTPGLRTIALDGDAISRDEAVRRDYDADPLNFRGKLTARTGREMNVAMGVALREAGSITCPVLIVHGGADQLTAPVGSERLAEVIGARDCTLRIWDGAYHELHHEPERDEVLDTIADWVLERAQPKGSR